MRARPGAGLRAVAPAVILGVGARVEFSYNHQRRGTVVREVVKNGERIGVEIVWDDDGLPALRYLDAEPVMATIVLSTVPRRASKLRFRATFADPRRPPLF